MIPVNVKINEETFIVRLKKHISRFKNAAPNQLPTLTNEQLYILERLTKDTKKAMPPLQKLEHGLHPFVSFVVIPIFALANAGITVVDIDLEILTSTHIALGVTLGLLTGKILGVIGLTWLGVRLKIAPFPDGMNLKNLVRLGLLSSIGFTMSLFIAQLAFDNPECRMQAKVGIFVASIIGGILGYIVPNGNLSEKVKE